MKVCPRWNIQKSHNEFNRNSCRKDGMSFWCKMCCIEHAKNHKLEKKEYDKNRYNSLRGRWMWYKDTARERNIEFNISLKQAERYYKTPCEYCDAPVDILAFDRVDNDKGYIVENVVSCCKICNYSKRH